MEKLQEVISYLNTLGIGGVGTFMYYLFKGVSEKVNILSDTINEQDKILKILREHTRELEKWRNDYKGMLNDFKEMGEKIDERKRVLINELQEAVNQKDKELAMIKSEQLKEINLKKESYERISFLEKQLTDTQNEMNSHLKILLPSSDSCKNIVEDDNIVSNENKFDVIGSLVSSEKICALKDWLYSLSGNLPNIIDSKSNSEINSINIANNNKKINIDNDKNIENKKV